MSGFGALTAVFVVTSARLVEGAEALGTSTFDAFTSSFGAAVKRERVSEGVSEVSERVSE